MKTIRSLRRAAFSATVAFACLLGPSSRSAAADSADRQLVSMGVIPVKAAGPYVELGTLRIQVSTKLGRPDCVLPDGSWLYNGRTVVESDARGTLVVRFNGGRVSELALVTPAVALAMQANPHKPLGAYLVANK